MQFSSHRLLRLKGGWSSSVNAVCTFLKAWMVGSWSVHYALLNFCESVLGYSVKIVLIACTNTMHSWVLEMFWVILWRQCLLLVQTVCTAEFWKCSGLFCEDSAYCLYKHYAQLRSGNILGYSKQTKFQLVQILCAAEFVWKVSGLLCAQCLLLLYSSENVLGYSVQTVLTACINTMHSWICLDMFWVMLCRQAYCLYKNYAQLNLSKNLWELNSLLKICTHMDGINKIS